MAATSFPCTSFATHSVPDIARHDYIIAICTIPQAYCELDAFAFHAADFAAFKSLFGSRIPKSHQVWLSACDPGHLNVLRHGTKDVRKAYAEDVVFQSDPLKLWAKFYDHLSWMSQKAYRSQSEDAPKGTSCASWPPRVAILVCGPTTPQQDILSYLPYPLSIEDRAYIVSTERLRNMIKPGVQSMLVTPNMHFGGWMVNISLTRADPPTSPLIRQSALSESEFVYRRVRRSLAPLFVDQSYEVLTRESSIMRTKPDRKNTRPLIPRDPTEVESAAALKFYGCVHEACFSNLLYAPRNPAFNFTVDLDNWSLLAGPRRGPHLTEHGNLWKTLDAHKEEPQSRSPFPFYCFGSNQEAQLTHLKTLAFIQREDWTRDSWDMGNQVLQNALDTAFELHSVAESMTEAQIEEVYITFMHISAFRHAASNLADTLAELASTGAGGGKGPLCSRPSRPRCVHWEASQEYRAHILCSEELDSDSSVLSAVRDILPRMPFHTPRLSSRIPYGISGYDFARPALYLSSIIAESTAGMPASSDTDAHVQGCLNYFKDILKTFIQDTLPEDLLRSPWVAGAGFGLLTILNKGPDQHVLSKGPITQLATGIASPPSEMMKISNRHDRNAGWRGSSRRAGGPKQHQQSGNDGGQGGGGRGVMGSRIGQASRSRRRDALRRGAGQGGIDAGRRHRILHAQPCVDSWPSSAATALDYGDPPVSESRESSSAETLIPSLSSDVHMFDIAEENATPRTPMQHAESNHEEDLIEFSDEEPAA